MMLIVDDHTGYTVGDKANRFIPSLSAFVNSFAKIQLFEFLSGNVEVPELPVSSVPSTPSGKGRSCSSQVGPNCVFSASVKGATPFINSHKKSFISTLPSAFEYCCFSNMKCFSPAGSNPCFYFPSLQCNFCLESILLLLTGALYHITQI